MKSATATCRGLLEGLSHALRNAQRRSVVQLVTWGLVVLGGCGGAAGQSPALNFQGAQWIWFTADPKVPLAAFPGDSCYCRVPFVLPETAAIKAAEVIITADNLYTLHLNGRVAGASEDNPDLWNRPKRFDVTSRLLPGRNMVAVEGVNTAPGPAGLILKLVAETSDGQRFTLVSDASWKCSDQATPHWEQAVFDDATWQPPRVIGEHGVAPWGQLTVPAQAERPLDDVAAPGTVPADFRFPEGIVFLGDDCSLHHFPVCFHMNNNSRAYPEWDLPCPSLMGRKLYALRPSRRKPRRGCCWMLGNEARSVRPASPTTAKHVYVALAAADDDFFHIYRVPVAGGPPRQLTQGAFHDIDPAELPDGRIVFTSTRIGSFEEYHQPPSRSLFVMHADGSEIQPLTFTPIGDNEPKVMADGRIAFVRSDNFFDRAKVETQIHAIHPDGTAGQTEAGADVGADYGVRLRALGFGSPAPLPDGRLAVAVADGQPGRPAGQPRTGESPPAAEPDGHLAAAGRPAALHDEEGDRRAGPEQQPTRARVPDCRGQDPFARVPGTAAAPARVGQPSHGVAGNGTAADGDPVLPERLSHAERQSRLEPGAGHPDPGWPAAEDPLVALLRRACGDRRDRTGHGAAGRRRLVLRRSPGQHAVGHASRGCRGTLGAERDVLDLRAARRDAVVRGLPPASPIGSGAESRVRRSAAAPPLKLLGQGEPHKFRGNNSGVTGMMDLQFERFREVASIDLHAHRSWAANTGPQGWAREVGRLLDQLGGPRADLKLSAAGRLAIFRERAAAPALAAALRDGNRELRVAAALALAACGTRASLPPLAEALADDDPLVSLAATVALENLTGHEEPLPAFGPPKVRTPHAAAWRLAGGPSGGRHRTDADSAVSRSRSRPPATHDRRPRAHRRRARSGGPAGVRGAAQGPTSHTALERRQPHRQLHLRRRFPA